MKVEIVMTGLCSFLNVRDVNETMPEPSVIFVQTNDDGMGGHHHHGGADHKHIPYLAFDANVVTVNDSKGFKKVSQSPRHKFLELSGVELRIQGVADGPPIVRASYDQKVVRRDDYWPEAMNKWNRDYVPRRGKNPKKSAVEMFMRFGAGVISASRPCPVEWIFPKLDGKTLRRKFAEEVVYSTSTDTPKTVVIEILDLESRKVVRTLEFTPKGKEKIITINLGNNMKGDMDNAVQRKTPSGIKGDGDHFKFLNRTARLKNGPFPKLGKMPPNISNNAGGVSGGACGPNNGNS